MSARLRLAPRLLRFDLDALVEEELEVARVIACGAARAAGAGAGAVVAEAVRDDEVEELGDQLRLQELVGGGGGRERRRGVDLPPEGLGERRVCAPGAAARRARASSSHGLSAVSIITS